jgi:hypothetical protein
MRKLMKISTLNAIVASYGDSAFEPSSRMVQMREQQLAVAVAGLSLTGQADFVITLCRQGEGVSKTLLEEVKDLLDVR